MTGKATHNRPQQTPEEPAAVKIPVGISACVLGQEVRYNGDHKLDRFIRDTLGTYVRFVPVCPEVEIGLGIPRETLRLVRGDATDADARLVAPKSGSDHTERMQAYARERLGQLAKENLCGYILQKGKVVLSGTKEQLISDERVRKAYFAMN